MSLTHNLKISDSEPNWSSYNDENRKYLPNSAFAYVGDESNKTTWKFPHHWVQDAKIDSTTEKITSGNMFLHKGGLFAAWAASQGARSGVKAPASVISHLQKHREELGLSMSENEILIIGLHQMGLDITDYIPIMRSQQPDDGRPLYTKELITSLYNNYNSSRRRALIKIGHQSRDSKEYPYIGFVYDLKLDDLGKENVISARFVYRSEYKDFLNSYPERSTELLTDKDMKSGKLTAVALLGQSPPAIHGLPTYDPDTIPNNTVFNNLYFNSFNNEIDDEENKIILNEINEIKNSNNLIFKYTYMDNVEIKEKELVTQPTQEHSVETMSVNNSNNKIATMSMEDMKSMLASLVSELAPKHKEDPKSIVNTIENMSYEDIQTRTNAIVKEKEHLLMEKEQMSKQLVTIKNELDQARNAVKNKENQSFVNSMYTDGRILDIQKDLLLSILNESTTHTEYLAQQIKEFVSYIPSIKMLTEFNTDLNMASVDRDQVTYLTTKPIINSNMSDSDITEMVTNYSKIHGMSYNQAYRELLNNSKDVNNKFRGGI